MFNSGRKWNEKIQTASRLENVIPIPVKAGSQYWYFTLRGQNSTCLLMQNGLYMNVSIDNRELPLSPTFQSEYYPSITRKSSVPFCREVEVLAVEGRAKLPLEIIAAKKQGVGLFPELIPSIPEDQVIEMNYSAKHQF